MAKIGGNRERRKEKGERAMIKLAMNRGKRKQYWNGGREGRRINCRTTTNITRTEARQVHTMNKKQD